MSAKSIAVLWLILGAFSASCAQNPPSFLDQHWDDPTRFAFWSMDQGSKIMPMKWFLQLQKAESSERFATGLERYGFVPDNYSGAHGNPSPDANNPLPIGFAKNSASGEDWVGLTCAACHTNKISSGSQSWLVEGGPSMLDFDQFLSDLVEAVDQIDKDPARAQAFWNGVPTPAQVLEFQQLKTRLDLRKRINTPPAAAGFGRVDAFGHIFNQVLTVGLNTEVGTAPPSAPASYPFLWDISQHEFVQWNGSAPNLGVGASAPGSLMRNIGEVLGVFGEFTVTGKHTDWGLPTYESSINVENLRKVEQWVSTLRSPKWPAVLGPIDESERAKGAEIYKAQCWGCHKVVAADQPVPVPVPVNMEQVDNADLQTDRAEIDNFLARKADAGILAGSFYPLDPSMPIFRGQTPVKDLTGYVAMGVYINLEHPNGAELLRTAALVARSGLPPLDRYKARPLDGIWATAPYLHNGSVASLKELLTAPKERLTRFCVGDGQYDPVNVGYQTYARRLPDGSVEANCAAAPRTSILDTTAPGSSNQGHTYGTDLSDVEKQQLLTYLKSL
jgi:hypothetical protein